jgi:predicted metal-binding protein
MSSLIVCCQLGVDEESPSLGNDGSEGLLVEFVIYTAHAAHWKEVTFITPHFIRRLGEEMGNAIAVVCLATTALGGSTFERIVNVIVFVEGEVQGQQHSELWPGKPQQLWGKGVQPTANFIGECVTGF